MPTGMDATLLRATGSNEVRLFLPAPTVMDRRLLMPFRERFDEPALHDEMVAGFSHRMDLD